MAYDATKPLDSGYLAEAPAELREQFRALKEDQIINAGALMGYSVGNASGNIPLNNGTLNTNLNADMLDGHDSAYFAAATHTHSAATENANGFMSNTDKVKLNSISSNAEVNQNAFSNVEVGSSTIQADGKTDTLTLAAGTGITLTADTANNKVTIKVTDNTYLSLAGGTMTGALTFANNVWNLVGDDVKIGDFNKAGTLGVKGANGTTAIALVSMNDDTKYATISYDETDVEISKPLKADQGVFSLAAGSENTLDAIYRSLLIKKALFSNGAPNNGVILQYNTNANYGGQLYIGDNATQGLYYNGWSDGKRGTWKKVAFTDSDITGNAATATNATKWNNKTLRLNHNTSDTWIPVFSNDIVDYVLKSEIVTGGGGAPKPTTSSGVGQVLRVSQGSAYTLPSGGTWLVYLLTHKYNSNYMDSAKVGLYSGGSNFAFESGQNFVSGLVWRIA